MSASQAVTYAKWGLMGVGGLVILKWTLGVILNPVILIGGAAAGGVGYWLWSKQRSKGAPVPAAEPDVRSASVAERSAVAAAEAELQAMESAVDPAVAAAEARAELERKRAEAAARVAAERDAHERRLAALAAMKEKVEREG